MTSSARDSGIVHINSSGTTVRVGSSGSSNGHSSCSSCERDESEDENEQRSKTRRVRERVRQSKCFGAVVAPYGDDRDAVGHEREASNGIQNALTREIDSKSCGIKAGIEIMSREIASLPGYRMESFLCESKCVSEYHI